MKQRLRFGLWLFLLLTALPLAAQQRLRFSIVSFEPDPFDQTAANPEYEKIDGSGNRYAIIKVTSDNPDDDLSAFSFNFGNLRHEIKPRDGELWVYVQKNAKYVTITRSGYAAVNRYSLPMAIEAGKVYTMKLSVQTPEVRHRILQFQVTPADEGAIVKVRREGDGSALELWELDATGSTAKRLETGVYVYEVSAEHYETTQGRVVLSYADDNYVEAVTLKPNFGYLEVVDEQGISGAAVYVNDRKVGTVPYTSKERWDVRDDYRIIVSNGDLYKPYNGTFAIRKGETTRISPKLESNFAETTINVDNNAEIVIEGISRGRGRWTGPLKAGTYNVECRLDERYRPTRKQITIKPDMAEIFVMDAPVPITGSVFVNSNPLGAAIQLDGKEVGQTPRELKDVLIGRHTVRVLRDGYRAEEKTVEVQEGKAAEVEFQLRDFARFTISSDPPARLTIDGKDVGMTPYSFEGASGEYDIRLIHRKYKTYHQTTSLRSSAPEQTFTLSRQYQLSTMVYLGAGFQVGSTTGIHAHAGAYLNNVNVEVSFLKGLSSETVYWHYQGDADVRPVGYTYKPTAYGVKLGYGAIMGNRFRLTPQAGCAILSVKSDDGESKCYAVSLVLSLRADYAFTGNIGAFVAPEADFTVKKSNIFSSLSAVSSSIKGWGSGFNIRAGLYISF